MSSSGLSPGGATVDEATGGGLRGSGGASGGGAFSSVAASVMAGAGPK